MEPTQATAQKRRRRRWPIVTTVLVFVSLASWWNWPRGDARFVEKWEVHVVGWSSQSGLTMILNRNGSGHSITTDNKQGVWYEWQVSGDELKFGKRQTNWIQFAANWMLVRFGRSVMTTEERWKIVEVQADRVQCMLPGADTIELCRTLE